MNTTMKPHEYFPIPRLERQGTWPRRAYSIAWWRTHEDGTLQIDVEFRKFRWSARRALRKMNEEATEFYSG